MKQQRRVKKQKETRISEIFMEKTILFWREKNIIRKEKQMCQSLKNKNGDY